MSAALLQLAKELGAGIVPAKTDPRQLKLPAVAVFKESELTAFALRIRAAALEEAAKACELLRDKWVDGSDQWGRPCPARVRVTTSDCAAAIRALAQPSTGEKT